jgi:hypothetical protein
MCGKFPPARISDLPRQRGSIPALLATPPSAKALMKDYSIAIAGLPGDFVSQDDEGLFAFVNTLRLSVKAKVAAEQQRGQTLAEIVIQVREMVRLAEEEQHPTAIPPSAFRAISRQAVAWCVEAFHPTAFVAENDLSPRSGKTKSMTLPRVLNTPAVSADRSPDQSPT